MKELYYDALAKLGDAIDWALGEGTNVVIITAAWLGGMASCLFILLVLENI